MKRRPFYLMLVIIFLGLVVLSCVGSRILFEAEENAYLMGTPVRVKIEGLYAFLYARLALAEIRNLEQSLSDRLPQSEISLLNRFAGLAPLQVSRGTYECLRLAQRLNQLTGGAFDVTLGDPEALVVNPETRMVFIKKKGVRIDLGGIGKGFAAEYVRSRLRKEGARSGMIDMRSSIAVFGKKSRRVGIQYPNDRWKLLGMVELKDGGSLATSGDYERGEHIIDPRSGKPARKCQSATVVCEDAAFADALSTALFVLGPIEGIRLVETLPGVEAMIFDREGKYHLSSGFIFAKP